MKQRGIFEKIPGSGIWWIRYVDAQGRYRREKAGTKSSAITLYRKRKTQALEGKKLPERLRVRTIQIDELADDLQNEYKANGRKSDGTLRWRLRNLKRYFSRRAAESITTSDIRGYISQRLDEGASPSTVRAELLKLKRMFNLAIQGERLERKPYIPMPAEANPRKGFFEPEQFERVLAALPDYLKPLAQFAYHTGWRRGEVTSLRWDQIDLSARVVRLWAGTTKSGEGRALPLEGELWRIIEDQHTKQLDGCPWVFHRNWKRILTFYKAWDTACAVTWWKQQNGDADQPLENIIEAYRASGSRWLFHDLRRSAARNFRRAGLSENEAMRLTGHKTPSVFRRYSIIAEEDLRDAVRASEAFLAPSGLRPAETNRHQNSTEEKAAVAMGS